MNCSCGISANNASTTPASMDPLGWPAVAKTAANPRRLGCACSKAINAAPPHSPPTDRPCTIRSRISRIGARIPAWSRVGRNAINAVATPIMLIVSTSTDFRPFRSPK